MQDQYIHRSLAAIQDEPSHLSRPPIVKLVSENAIIRMKMDTAALQSGKNQSLDPRTFRSQCSIDNDVATVAHTKALQVRAAIDDGNQLLRRDITSDESKVSQLLHKLYSKWPLSLAAIRPLAQHETLQLRACSAGDLICVAVNKWT
jgi:hypothetical protein